MIIEKQCGEVVKTAKPVVKLADIPNGTVFRYGNHIAGPYLRIKSGAGDGVFSLKDNAFNGPSIYNSVAGDYDFNAAGSGYLPLPHAKLVTGEV